MKSGNRAPEVYRITKSRLLLVEGRDDEEFLKRLCEHAGISSLQVINYGGKPKLRDSLEILPTLPKFETVTRIGVTRDADESAESARQSVRDALTNATLPQPTDAFDSSADNLQTSVMIIPDGEEAGCLETLLWKTIEDPPTEECVQQYVDCMKVPSCGNRRVKAKVHTYLSAQNDPGLKIGEAARNRYFNLDHPALGSLTRFISALAA